MTHDATASRPLDLRDLRDAETLGAAWDAWLHDDLEPTRHQSSTALAPGVAATVEDLYDNDDSPAPSAAFRLGLKRDLLHVHDALRLGAASGVDAAWSTPATTPAPARPARPMIPVPPTRIEPPKRARRPERRWRPAVEFAAALLLILALFGVTFGNARLAEFFRDDTPGRFAAQGDPTAAAPAPSPAPTAPLLTPDVGAAPAPETDGGPVSAGADGASPIAGTLENAWLGKTNDDRALVGRPSDIVVADGFVAVVSSEYESFSIMLTLFTTEGERLWTTNVNDGFVDGLIGAIDAAPIIDAGKLYFLNRASFLYVFDLATYPDPEGLLFARQLPFTATSSRPVVLDGIVYVTGGFPNGQQTRLPDLAELNGTLYLAGDSSSGLIGVDPVSGDYVLDWPVLQVDPELAPNGLWEINPVRETITDWWQSPDFVVTKVSPLGTDRLTVMLATPNGDTVAASVRDAGDISAEVNSFWPEASLYGSPVVVGASVVVVDNQTVSMFSFNPDTGEAPRLFWDYSNARSKPDPVIGGDATIVVSDEDAIRLYDPLTGQMVGETPIGANYGEVTAIDTADGLVFVAFEDGTVARFDPLTPETTFDGTTSSQGISAG